MIPKKINCEVNVKTMRTIAHIFVAFSEKLNFKSKILMRLQIGIGPNMLSAEVSLSMQCTLLAFQQNSPIYIVVRILQKRPELTVCSVCRRAIVLLSSAFFQLLQQLLRKDRRQPYAFFQTTLFFH